MLPKISRSAARIICLDRRGRILLLRWRDPFDGSVKWEPPGGGIEPGETPYEAACRELIEETGLDQELILPAVVKIERSYRWNGRELEGREWFYLARVDRARLQPARMLASEVDQFRGYRWVVSEQLKALPEPVEPPELLDIVRRLTVTS